MQLLHRTSNDKKKNSENTNHSSQSNETARSSLNRFSLKNRVDSHFLCPSYMPSSHNAHCTCQYHNFYLHFSINGQMVEMHLRHVCARVSVRAMDLSIINLCDNFNHNFTVSLIYYVCMLCVYLNRKDTIPFFLSN